MSVQSLDASQFQLLTMEEAAQLLRTPVSTLRYWRHMNKGPRAARIGGRIMYRLADLESWLEAQFDQA